MPLIDEGQKAPAFSLPDQSGKTHSLKDYAGRPVVLYFYPKDDTPGCTTEACSFRDALPDFSKVKATILGVSVLDSDEQGEVREEALPEFPAPCRRRPRRGRRYGAWQEKSMYGRKYMGVARITYLIDGSGKSRSAGTKSASKHADEVLAASNALLALLAPSKRARAAVPVRPEPSQPAALPGRPNAFPAGPSNLRDRGRR